MVTYEMNFPLGGLVYMIQSVFVEKEHRGKGVFRALYQKTFEMGTTDPMCRALRLYVETENEVAQKVYQKMGMNAVDFSFDERDYYFDE